MKKLSYEQVKLFIENSSYTLLSSEYNNAQTHLNIKCPYDHEYKVRFYNFKNGKRCPVCKGGASYTIKQFIEKCENIHNDKYDYSLVEYFNRNSLVKIICPEHGVFEQRAGQHLNGHGCHKCTNQFHIGYAKNSIPLFDTYAPQLQPYGVECKRSSGDENILEVECVYCGKLFVPKLNSVLMKIRSIKGVLSGELNLYCSDGCKRSCPVYNRKKFPKGFKLATSREVQPQLRKLVLERDDWTCQKCGSMNELHCHHIDGIEINPIESADIDNCITFCKGCHKEVHRTGNCNTRRKNCEKSMER